jgi:hypothetical protein
MCPHCRQNAPLVYRGVLAYCAACGKPRVPLSGSSLQLAGQPSKVGGTLARVFGWVTLVFGLSAAAFVGLLLQWIFPAGIAGFVVGVPLALLVLGIGLMLLLGGGRLKQSGEESEKRARIHAIFALAAHRRGIVTAREAATALGVPLPSADALLTEMAKQESEMVRLEVDDRGEIYFRFPMLEPPPEPGGPVRVDASIAPRRIETVPNGTVGGRAGAEAPAAGARLDDALEEQAVREAHEAEAAAHRRSRG